MSLAVTDLDKVLKRLVEVGSRRKWICYEELNTCLPDEFVDPEKIDELFVLIGELGIEMVDEPEMRRNQWIKFYAPLQTNLKFQRDEPKSRQREKHVPAAEDRDEQLLEHIPLPDDGPRHRVKEPRSERHHHSTGRVQGRSPRRASRDETALAQTHGRASSARHSIARSVATTKRPPPAATRREPSGGRSASPAARVSSSRPSKRS